MKKMAIVPYKMLEEMQRWKSEQHPKLPPTPQVSKTVDLQKDMQAVLQREDLSESEKAQLYGETLQKFQMAHKKALQPQATLTSLSTPPPPPPVTAEETPVSTIQDQIMTSVPVTMQRKAKLLLRLIEGHPNMAWNNKGVLEYQGKPIPGSNVIDLVNDVLRQRKGSKPKGWEKFAHGLKEINVPQEVIGNKQRWAWMIHNADPTEDEDEFFDTSDYLPATPPPSTKKGYKTPTPTPSTSKWESY